MDSEHNGNSPIKKANRYDNGHVQEVIRQAHEELQALLQQRADLTERIGTLKQTIANLDNLFGDGVLSEELMKMVDSNSSGRQPGFTKACRMILMEARRAMTARDVCEDLQQIMPALLTRHRDPMASITTVLNRLVHYGEAQKVLSGTRRRSWLWVAESHSGPLLPSRDVSVE